MTELMTAFSSILAIVNLFAIMILIATIGEIYNMNSLYYVCIAQTAYIIINVLNIRVSVWFDSLGYASLTLLIQVGVLITCVLLIKIILKDDYKHNVKPSLQIKI